MSVYRYTNRSCFMLTVPSKPQYVKVLEVTSNTIKISWYEPEKANGVIHAYRVYYMFLNQTLLHLPMLKNDGSSGSLNYYTLSNLSELFFIYINDINYKLNHH